MTKRYAVYQRQYTIVVFEVEAENPEEATRVALELGADQFDYIDQPLKTMTELVVELPNDQS